MSERSRQPSSSGCDGFRALPPPGADSLAAPDPALQAVVVVPARDEAARISACLLALAQQHGLAANAYEAIVVLDGCRDATYSRAAEVAVDKPRLRLHLLKLPQPGGVGRARRIGMDLAFQRLEAVGMPKGLIACTDADSIVAKDWLTAQLELVRKGARAIGGRIELLLDERSALPDEVLAERRRRAVERMEVVVAASSSAERALVEHHQFSGASLALTADAYRECGGLPVRAALEDEALERELVRRGIPIHRSCAVRVSTSARTNGRAPRGLSRDLSLGSWRARRSFQATQFPLERLLEHKRTSVALVLPAREVSETIGPIANCAVSLREAGLLDEVIVVDAASRDGTARVAEAAGATAVQEDELLSELGPACGKGDAMWRALSVLDSDIVIFADTDTEDFAEHFLTGLLGPLICEPDVHLVKGFFKRPFRMNDTLVAHGGGRVTELLARPLLNLHAPELAVFDQPLAGEIAARRELLERISFSVGYGVEIGMLIDAWRLVGLDGLAQVDLGVRQNRHQPLRDLSAMAYAVLVTAQSRFLGPEFTDAHASGSIALPPLELGDPMETRRVPIDERPPLDTRRAGRLSAPPAPHWKSHLEDKDHYGSQTVKA